MHFWRLMLCSTIGLLLFCTDLLASHVALKSNMLINGADNPYYFVSEYRDDWEGFEGESLNYLQVSSVSSFNVEHIQWSIDLMNSPIKTFKWLLNIIGIANFDDEGNPTRIRLGSCVDS